MTEKTSIVSVSTYGRAGSSTRVRMYDWFDHLGVESERHEYVGTADNQPSTLAVSVKKLARAELDVRLLARRMQNRTVLLSRQASPFSSGTVEASILRAAGHSVYDFDDALHSADTSTWSRKIWSKRRVWERSIRTADVVIAGSPHLAEAAERFSKDVVMIPSCVAPDLYIKKNSYELSQTPRAVWIGSPATEAFLITLTSPLLQLHERFGLRVSVVSAGLASLGPLDTIVDRYTWTQSGFAALIAKADFGIMPLPDTPFTRGKCSYKILQYAAAGLPIVGSPVGANESIMSQLGGLSAIGHREWYDAIEGLLDESAAARRARGAVAAHGVATGFSFSAWEAQWRDALDMQV